jgi:ABC-type Fe3+-hydroxamate transport system substrate-binding protein
VPVLNLTMLLKNSIDQMGYSILAPFPPKRIISLVPSQTELLAFLGLNQQTVGITRFCVHPPEWVDVKPKIGGTKRFDFDAIDRLKPDLIIGNKEENYEEGIQILKNKYPVWMSDIYTLQDALDMITHVGAITDQKEKSIKLVEDISTSFSSTEINAGKSVLYLIWKKPWMAAGPDTFINDMLKKLGCRNVVNSGRYPKFSDEEMKALNPDVVLLSSEPYPFSEKHFYQLKKMLPASTILLVDGEMFSWYGSRLLYACDYFKSLPL